MAVAPLTAGRFLATWRFDPWVAAAAAAAGGSYARGLTAVRRKGLPWPRWRTTSFVGLGLGGLVVTTMSGLATYDRVLFWVFALQLTLLLAVIPVLLALGDPLRLLVAALPERSSRRVERVLGGRVVRALTFPLVTPLLAVATVFVVLFTGYLPAALEHPGIRDLLYLHLVVAGCLFALPMFGTEALPAWCTPGVKVLVSAADGLLDAIPAIVVMTGPGYYSSTGGHLVAAHYYTGLHLGWLPSPRSDQILGGGLMLTLTELVGLPFLVLLVAAWIRADREEARQVDDYLDTRPDLLVPPPNPQAAAAEAPALMRPWWETDPRFRNRYRRQPPPGDG